MAYGLGRLGGDAVGLARARPYRGERVVVVVVVVVVVTNRLPSDDERSVKL